MVLLRLKARGFNHPRWWILTERNAVIEEHRVFEQALKHSHGHILVGDVEEEIANQRATQKLIAVSHVRPHAPSHRSTLVGDVRQHQSVETGRIFEELQKAGMKTAQLNKVVRQKDEELKRAVILMANGRITDGVEAFH
jgi:hypothetical protein